MFAATMPKPTSTVTRSGKYGPFQQVRRDVTTRWVLNPEAEGVPQVVVEVTTQHNPESKTFSSSMTWATIETRPLHPKDGSGGYTSWCWSSDHASKQILRQPVPRYSVKALEMAHEIAMAQVAERWSHFDGVFAEAAERSGLTMQEA